MRKRKKKKKRNGTHEMRTRNSRRRRRRRRRLLLARRSFSLCRLCSHNVSHEFLHLLTPWEHEHIRSSSRIRETRRGRFLLRFLIERGDIFSSFVSCFFALLDFAAWLCRRERERGNNTARKVVVVVVVPKCAAPQRTSSCVVLLLCR